MNTESQNLYQRALGLPASERAALAASLFRSLDEETDPNAEQEWAIELERRIAEIDRGEVQLIPWESVMAEMRYRSDG